MSIPSHYTSWKILTPFLQICLLCSNNQTATPHWCSDLRSPSISSVVCWRVSTSLSSTTYGSLTFVSALPSYTPPCLPWSQVNQARNLLTKFTIERAIGDPDQQTGQPSNSKLNMSLEILNNRSNSHQIHLLTSVIFPVSNQYALKLTTLPIILCPLICMMDTFLAPRQKRPTNFQGAERQIMETRFQRSFLRK